MNNLKTILAKTFLTVNSLLIAMISLSFFVFGCNSMFMASAPSGAFCRIDIPLLSDILIASQIIFLLFILLCIVSFGLPVIIYGLLWWRAFVVAKENFKLFVLAPILIPAVLFLMYAVHHIITINYRLSTQNEPVDIEQLDQRAKIQNDVDETENNVASKTICTESSLYSFNYYVAPNTESVCYQNYQMNGADPLTLIPLENVSLSISQTLIPNARITAEQDFAFDKNNFYINGDPVYTTSGGTFSLINSPRPGQDGEVIIEGASYRVVMTGLVGATLK